MSAETTSGAPNTPIMHRPVRATSAWVASGLWAAAMLPLAFWGLPDSSDDALLFGGRPAWEPQRYHAAAGLEQRASRTAGADTDLDPIAASQLVNLTQDEAGRAEILRRFRLYSHQPDEMITFMALQRMHPRQGDFDPHLYQYGGAYIYLVGGAVGAAALTGTTTLSHGIDAYLSNPELFGRFYFTSRLISLAFGAAGLAAAWRMGQQLGGRLSAWCAWSLLAVSPGWITSSLEAKPHIASACLVLWAIVAALDYNRGAVRAAWRVGLRSGLAFGFVLTGVLAGMLWPVLWLYQRRRWRALAGAGLLAVSAYAVTNPYVVRHALRDPAALRSNLGNSRAMYTGQTSRAVAGALRTGELLLMAAPVPCLLGLVGALRLAIRQRPQPAILGAVPAAYLAMGVLLLAGKPAEAARFLLVPAAALAVTSGLVVHALFQRSQALGHVALTVALACEGFAGYRYLRSFAIDAFAESENRRAAATFIETYIPREVPLGVTQVPAPYATPPLDFADRTIILLPARDPGAVQDLPRWLALTADDASTVDEAWWRAHYKLRASFPQRFGLLGPTPITWANKPVFLFEAANSGQAAGR